MVELLKTVYDLSKPQGMGFLHFMTTPMTVEEATKLLNVHRSPRGYHFDYINGRACKFNIFFDGEKHYINDSWYDHTNKDFETLLKKFNLEVPHLKEHEESSSCNCVDCQRRR